MLFVAAALRRTQDNGTHSRNLHQEDSYYRMARAIDAKNGVLVVDDVIFNDMPPLGVPLNQRGRVHMQRTKGVQIGWRA